MFFDLGRDAAPILCTRYTFFRARPHVLLSLATPMKGSVRQVLEPWTMHQKPPRTRHQASRFRPRTRRAGGESRQAFLQRNAPRASLDRGDLGAFDIGASAERPQLMTHFRTASIVPQKIQLVCRQSRGCSGERVKTCLEMSK